MDEQYLKKKNPTKKKEKELFHLWQNNISVNVTLTTQNTKSSGSQTSMHQNHLEDVLKLKIADSTPVFWFNIRVCIFNKFPGNADASGTGNILWELFL